MAAPGGALNPFRVAIEAITDSDETDSDLPSPPPRAGNPQVDLGTVISGLIARAHTEPAVLLLYILLRSNAAFSSRVRTSTAMLLEPLIERLLYGGCAASTSELAYRIQTLSELVLDADKLSPPGRAQLHFGELALLAITRCLVDNLALFHDDYLAEACHEALRRLAPRTSVISDKTARELAKAMRGALRRYVHGDPADRERHAKAVRVYLEIFNIMLRSRSCAASNIPLLAEVARLHRELGPTWATLPQADIHWLQSLPRLGAYFANALETYFENNPHHSQNVETRATVLVTSLSDAPENIFLAADEKFLLETDHAEINIDESEEAYAWEVTYSTTRNDLMWDQNRIKLFDLLVLRHWTPGDEWPS